MCVLLQGSRGNGLGFMVAGDLEGARRGIAVIDDRGESASGRAEAAGWGAEETKEREGEAVRREERE